MENSISTIVCPNCGANPSNHHNCEYCGSMLIRFVDKNIDVDISKYSKAANVVIPGLEAALKSNLLIQEHPIPNVISITQLIRASGDELQVFPIKEATFGLNQPNPYKGDTGIVLRIPFMVRSSNTIESQNSQKRLTAFKELDCFPLFDNISTTEGEFYLLDCGKDYITASRILSNVLVKYGRTDYKCSTINIKKNVVELDSTGHIANKKDTRTTVVFVACLIFVLLFYIFIFVLD